MHRPPASARVTADEIIQRIAALPSDWHASGSLSAAALRAIARHVASIGTIEHTAETGTGRSTLLFSHLSPDHRVFALDCGGGSLDQARASDLLRTEAVTFVEGPTQLTMPAHRFPDSLQAALIDGPHGYPFPDLEYFHLYPRFVPGAVLMIDDIVIPTIGRMVDILKADAMWELVEVVEGKLAFLRRTDAPTIEPTSDSWWLQGYNRDYHAELERGARRGRAIDAIADAVPAGLKRAVPQAMKEWVWRRRS